MLSYDNKIKQLSNCYNKDWLLGFVYCLYSNKLITGEKSIYLNNWIGNNKRK